MEMVLKLLLGQGLKQVEKPVEKHVEKPGEILTSPQTKRSVRYPSEKDEDQQNSCKLTSIHISLHNFT